MTEPEAHLSTFSHQVYFTEYQYGLLNEHPLKDRKATLEEIAETQPITAYSLFVRFLERKSDVMPRATVQTELGLINDYHDGQQAARGVLLHQLRQNFAGSSVIQPTVIEIATYTVARHARDSENEPLMLPTPQFSIDARPPDLAT